MITSGNILSGILSMILTLQGHYQPAAWLILAAVFFDAMDGKMARSLGGSTEFGVELDSLADVVSFGAAPALLFYAVFLWGWFGIVGALAAAFFGLCGALRLARFNVQIGVIDSRFFNGLPIPGGAAVVGTGIVLYYFLGGEGPFPELWILIGSVALALCMVSSIKYYSFKDLNFFSRKPFMSFVLIILILAIVVANPEIMLFTFAFGYSLSGPVWLLYRLMKKVVVDMRSKKNQYEDHLV
jgi:CDP-diacylglycerol--serine O-phosphatidyltransferase